MIRSLRIVALAIGLVLVGSLAGDAQEPKKEPPKEGKGFQKGGRGGGRFAPPQPGQVLAPFLVEMLKLTDDQKKELETLQKEVDAKLAKLLTEDQQKQLKEMRERGPFGFGGGIGGPGGGFGRRPDGKGPPPKGEPKKKDE